MINWNAFHRAVYHLISEHLFVKLKNYQNYQQTIKRKKACLCVAGHLALLVHIFFVIYRKLIFIVPLRNNFHKIQRNWSHKTDPTWWHQVILFGFFQELYPHQLVLTQSLDVAGITSRAHWALGARGAHPVTTTDVIQMCVSGLGHIVEERGSAEGGWEGIVRMPVDIVVRLSILKTKIGRQLWKMQHKTMGRPKIHVEFCFTGSKHYVVSSKAYLIILSTIT